MAESLLTPYCRDAVRAPLLTAADEKELAHQIAAGRLATVGSAHWEAGRAARERFTTSNLKLVVSIAKCYQGRGLDLPDLIQVGNMGLMKAVDHFDPGKDSKFSTYASHWIKMVIRRALKDTGRPIRIPVHVHDAMADVAAGRQVTPGKARCIRQAEKVWHLDSLDWNPAGWDGPSQDHSRLLVDGRSASPEAIAEDGEMQARAIEIVGKMARSTSGDLRRMAAVLRMRYGLDGELPMKLRDIGKEVGVTHQMVVKIEAAGLERMRKLLEG